MKLTTIGLVIFSIGLAIQISRLESRIDRLEYRGAVTTSVPADLWEQCHTTGCTTVTPN